MFGVEALDDLDLKAFGSVRFDLLDGALATSLAACRSCLIGMQAIKVILLLVVEVTIGMLS